MAIEESCRGFAVGGTQQQQAAGPQRSHEPVEDQLGVADAMQEHRALNDVERPGKQRHRAELAECG